MPVPDNEAKNQERALELNSNMVNRPPLGPPGEPPADLAAVVADSQATWTFSKEGGTGAILVTSDLEPSGGAAIKVEGKAAAAQVMKSAQLMETFMANAQGECPVNIPRVQHFSGAEALGEGSPVAALKTKLETLHAAGDATDKKRIANQLTSLQEVANGNSAVLKMELAPGPTFNKLPQEDKMALLKTEQLGRSLGRALPTVVVLQQNDHLGLDGGGSGFKANPTNLTFAPDTGQASLIDLSSRMNYVGDDAAGNPMASLGQGNVAGVMRHLNNFQQKALATPESFEKAIDDMVNGKNTPFKSMMDAFVNEKEADGLSTFLNPNEKDKASAELTVEDKRRFAANLLVGSVEGLEYPKQNMDALRTAAISTHETLEIVDRAGQTKQVEAEHFYTDEALQDLDDQFASVDVDDLKQKAGLRMAEMAEKQEIAVDKQLAELNTQAGQLHDQAKELEKRIAKLEANKPNLQDRLKAAYRGKSNMVADLKGRLENVQGEMADLHKQSNSLLNTKAFNQAMSQQTPGPRAHAALSVASPASHAPSLADPSSSVGVSSSSSSSRRSSTVGDVLRASSSSSSSSLRAPSQSPAEVPVKDALKAKAPKVAKGPKVEGLVSQYEAVVAKNAPTVTPPPKRGRGVGS